MRTFDKAVLEGSARPDDNITTYVRSLSCGFRGHFALFVTISQPSGHVAQVQADVGRTKNQQAGEHAYSKSFSDEDTATFCISKALPQVRDA